MNRYPARPLRTRQTNPLLPVREDWEGREERPGRASDLTTGAPARLAVFDLAGRRVRAWDVAAGSGEVTWNLLDERGVRAPSGVYWAELSQGSQNAVRRLAVLH